VPDSPDDTGDDPATGTPAAPGGGRRRAAVAGRCVTAGACLGLALPPWGWWPLAFVGIAVWDLLLEGARPIERFRRSWLVAAAWLFPSMVWIAALTPPGYLFVCAVFAAYFGVATLAVPPGPWRRLALPGAIVVAELARWSVPLSGIPLSTLAMGQADAPLAQTARLGNAILVSGLVAIVGVGLSAAWRRQWRPAGLAAGLVAVALVLAAAAPRGEAVGTLDIAVVQGGGEQGTRASNTDERLVFEAHVDASRQIDQPVDVILWPENVVSVEGRLVDNPEQGELEALSAELGAPIIAGSTEGITDTDFLNASVVHTPDGQGDRYDKELRVPFGEYVPFRSLFDSIAPNAGLPARDAVAGTGDAVLDVTTLDGTEVPLAVVISWEVFFTDRAREGVQEGGEVLVNPTNGSSYWLTQIQTQQVASSRLRGIETGRWVVQAAPTGFSAVVTPDGEVAVRTAVSERRVLIETVERRTGLTWATRLGQLPVAMLGLVAIAPAWLLARRRPAADDVTATAGGAADRSATPPTS